MEKGTQMYGITPLFPIREGTKGEKKDTCVKKPDQKQSTIPNSELEEKKEVFLKPSLWISNWGLSLYLLHCATSSNFS